MGVLLKIIRRSFWKVVGMIMLFGIVGLFYLDSTLPSTASLKDVRLQVPLRVYSEEGQLIGEFGEERRTPITLKDVPPNLIHAVLSTEDRRFYEHPGVDLRGLLRASVILLTNSSIKQGGSTITMQVARNFFLSRKKTFTRKLSEILLALKIEKNLSKDEILELYLNKIYFGKRAYGIAAAAEVYYGVNVNQLTLDQAAMLAGLPQAPSHINPLHNPEAAFKRRKHVLERMLSYEFITQKQYDEAVNAPLPKQYHGRYLETDAPYVAEMIRQDLHRRYGDAIYAMGYEVYTTIKSDYQLAANLSLKRALLEYDQRHGYRKPKIRFKFSKNKNPEEDLEHWLSELKDIPHFGHILPGIVMRIEDNKAHVLLQDERYIEIPWAGLSWARPQLKGYRLGASPKKPSDVVSIGDVIYAEETPTHTWKMVQIPEASGALVALNPDTGEILALVGGFDHTLSNFNRVIQAERQPGSNFKPLLYAAALEQGYTLASIINDSPIVYTDPVSGAVWRPENATKKFYGPTRLRVSLARSQNMVTIRLLQAIGLTKFIDFTEKFGFKKEKMPKYLSLSLGVAEVTPLEMATAYSVFANGGYRVTPNLVRKIKDYQGKIIYEAPPPTSTQTLDPKVAFLMTSALQEAIKTGTAQRAKSLGRKDLAGKTGSTNDFFDAWYSGYNRDVVATAWVGFDEPRTLREFGATAALPMWMYFMEAVLKDKPEHGVTPPPGIVNVKIDPDTGLLANDDQPNAIDEFFKEDTLPNKASMPAEENPKAPNQQMETLF